MKKITDPKLLKELYDTEADWKLLIGYRFKGSLGQARRQAKHKAAGVSRNGGKALKNRSQS